MGVPGLFPFIKNNYPSAILNFTPDDPTKRWIFDYAYLDSNPLLHDAVRFIFNIGEYKRIIDNYAKLSYEEKELKVFELFFEKIIEILTLINPQKLLYIAIDGCAPRAKMNQQRERRFGSGLERHEKELAKNMDIIDTSMITPGTEFMHRLSQFMFFRLRKYIQDKKLKYNVIYDPPTSPGEGEHKIMDFIRTLSHTERETATHCMFGPDGDLLFLTLSAHLKKIHLLREDKQDNKQGYYDLVNSTAIAEGLINTLNQQSTILNNTRSIYDVSNDFALIGFFVGNDFLPKIKMFLRLNDGLNKLIGTYITINKQNFILTKDSDVDINSFSRFVYYLSKSEEKYLSHQSKALVKDVKLIDLTLISCMVGDAIDMDAYRQAYYNKAGIMGYNGEKNYEEQIEKMCASYFKNLIWVYKYYTVKLQSWEESYKYHHAPLMKDLAKYLNNLRKLQKSHQKVLEVTTFDMSKPSLPFEQLLSVLSPYSYKLLPKELQHLMIDENSSLNKAKIYPKTFELDCEGKTQAFQCSILLPFVDSKLISSAYNDFNKNSKWKWHRNEATKSYTFAYKESGFSAKFISAYGTIENCKVKVSVNV